jgi:D-alanyl-D-alanine carboxypeptidase (penicillin-binding protein 5/6)
LRYPQYHNDYFPNIKRAEEAARVMDMAFREFRHYTITNANQVVGQAAVKGGAQTTVPVTPNQAIAVTMQVDSHSGVKTQVQPDSNLAAPIAQGQKVGMMAITAPDFPTMNVPVYATQAVNRASIFVRAWDSVFQKH